METLDFLGQTLDGKYHIERELGRGGMGTVYLATHLGTERPVAVKIIAPQYMKRAEFVERFRREARAAGRLRHPNVVNVTDFGFADSNQGQVAYLVMEYLDGCTLGEILEEERNLPVGWTLDILEQVCSAVHEAHTQGIIHRDLKPDNIWLEPNQRGGYTVKVLDFGIAKLEEHDDVASTGERDVYVSATPTYSASGKATFAGGEIDGTQVDANNISTQVAEAKTIAGGKERASIASEAGTISLSPIASENETAILDDGDISDDFQDKVGTGARPLQDATPQRGNPTTNRSLYDSKNSADLTRVGAVLGTPLYMSPEQCRGEHLDPRSDIYSLGVIAYQMLSGRTPFEGDFKDVMESHKTIEPKPLKAKNVRRKLKAGIHLALHKNPEFRPQTAEAFASKLRARSEGIWGLLRRALVIWSEHLPKFLLLTAFFSLPMIVLTLILLALSFLRVSDMISETVGSVSIAVDGFALSLASAFCTSLIVGTISWIVTQYLSVPLRPVRLRPALVEARKKWKRIAGTAFLTAILPFVIAGVAGALGFAVGAMLGLLIYPLTQSVAPIPVMGFILGSLCGLLGFFWSYISFILVPPVVMMEDVGVRAALKRSRALVKRSFWTAFGAICIMILIPGIIAGTISYVVNVSAKAFDPTPKTPTETVAPQSAEAAPAKADAPVAEEKKEENGIDFSFNKLRTPKVRGKDMDMRTRVKYTILESLIQIFWLPMQILVFSFSAIIVALLYLKTRLAGGESMNELLERFEDDERPRKRWQERVRARLIQSGRIPSKP
ncbi:MAG TPA: protein kinase [Pyrinomonadaceae bacterium]|nr:protein kinase [Pyrinomonadaceae bacterium]